MATITRATGAVAGAITLSSAQTGNGDSTNVADRGVERMGMPAALVVTSAVGATPTVIVNIMGSVDEVNWFNLPYALNVTLSATVYP